VTFSSQTITSTGSVVELGETVEFEAINVSLINMDAVLLHVEAEIVEADLQ
jgi:hypothetical protein